MNGHPVEKHTAEGEELNACRRELARLSDALAAKEMELTELRISLSRFEARYFSIVGGKYAELDELLARLAEMSARSRPDDESLAKEARQARKQADWSAEGYRTYGAEPETPGGKMSVPDEIKKLYRKIASRIHPDKAHDEASRTVRTRLMAELNDAYAEGDVVRMQEILAEWESSPESVSESGPAAELLRLKRTIAQVKNKIDELKQKIGRVKKSGIYKLMVKVREAEAGGEDLLRELAEELEMRIRSARQAFSAGGE